MKNIILANIPIFSRAVIQALAGSEVADTDITSKLTGVLIFVVTIIWSNYEKKQIKTKAEAACPVPPPTV